MYRRDDRLEMHVQDPDYRALSRHGGAQCEETDRGYRCTFVAGHGGNDHQTWANKINHRWVTA